MGKQEPLSTLIQQTDIRHIAIEGVIGAGKTTLCNMLGETLGGKVVLEKFEENPFLKDFYKDPDRYAFQTQIFFLLTRYKQQRDLFQADLEAAIRELEAVALHLQRIARHFAVGA